ncbi:MAG: N-acetylmuramoyl-L-alanine amidase [Chloroflexi bacterium]|nr:N-acetylmuramoyl-L-alanine amidase [Chloroflexota bacterium]
MAALIGLIPGTLFAQTETPPWATPSPEDRRVYRIPSEAPCVSSPVQLPAPGQPFPESIRSSFRDPLPLATRWNPPGPVRVGLQAGHWLTDQVPPELSRLQGGSSGGGYQEWEVNLQIARYAASLLEEQGIIVDVLPTTVPERYRAQVFVSIHADGDTAGQLSGFKVARPGFSSLPEVDDRLVESLNSSYGRATGLARDDEHISVRMRYYYAFNSRRYCSAVAPGVPQAIIEAGFLTSSADRRLLIGTPAVAARGIADGILAFLADSRG